MKNFNMDFVIVSDDVFVKYQFLRTLLSHEFILHKAWENMVILCAFLSSVAFTI